MLNMRSHDEPMSWASRAEKEVREHGRIQFTTGFVLQEAGIDVAALERRLLDQSDAVTTAKQEAE